MANPAILCTVTFLVKNNFKILSVSPGTTTNVSTTVTITTQWVGTPVADGTPMTFTAYDPNYNEIGTPQTIQTVSGGATFNFSLSDIAGYNWVSINSNGIR